MQKSIWKLAALAGVVGVGFLGVMQAQRGLSRPDGNAAEKMQFDDFESSGQPENDAVAGTVLDDEIGFGQFEPFSESGDRKAGSAVVGSQSEFEVAANDVDGRQPDPFAETSADPPFSKSGYNNSAAREADNSKLNSPSFGGLDFRDANAASARSLAEQPPSARSEATAVANTDPFDAADDDFQPQAANDTRSTDGPPSAATSQETTGVARVAIASEFDASISAAGPIIRQASQIEPVPEPSTNDNDDGQSDNPFAADGPRLLAPAADTRSIDEPTVSKSDLPDVPFKRLPRLDETEGKPTPDDRPHVDVSHGSKADETPAADDSPVPDPDAFDDDRKNDPPTTTDESPSKKETGSPLLKSFDDKPAKSQTAAPEAPPVPLPAAASTVKQESTVKQKKSDTANLQEAATPNRLTPHPKAVRLVPPTDDDLAGDATIGANAPRGPQTPRLNIVKQAPPNAVLGQPMIYSIVVKNVGNSPAAQVTVEDRIPRGTRLTGTIPQAEMYNKKLIWKIGTLKPNEQRTIQVRVVPFEAGQIGSIATVNFVTEVAARTLVTSPSLKLDVLGPPRANVGGRITLKFKVKNNGTSNATGVVLRNLLPSQLSHPGGKDLEYQVGDLAAGQAKEISLLLTATKPGKAVSRAVITADGNLTAEAAATVEIAGSRLKLTRSGPKRRYLGRPATYVNRVTNQAGTPVGPITIVEAIPAGLKFLTATDGGQFNQVQRTVAWQIDKLAAGESKDVRVELTATSKGTQSSTVTASGPAGRPVRIESRTEVVGLAALSANLSGIAGPIPVGKTITLQIRVANRGNESASGVTVRLTLPDQLTFVTSDGAAKATANGSEVRFAPLRPISPQKEQALTIVLKATRPGEARLKVQIDADQLSRPLTRDDALVIFDDSP